jgi:hypothetical protein
MINEEGLPALRGWALVLAMYFATVVCPTSLNAPETVTEAAEIMRGLIDRIVLMPVDGELRAELHGDLAVLARFAQEGERRSDGNPARLSVVAGERNPLYRTVLHYRR